MSVKFSVVYKDGTKESHTAVCFGVMESGFWETNHGHNEITRRNGLTPKDQKLIEFNTTHMPCDDWPGDSPKEKSRSFIKELNLIISEFKPLQGLVTTHPILGCVRVHVDGKRIEDVMMALFLIRNLCQYQTFVETYKFFRQKQLSPLFSAVMCHLVYKGAEDFEGNTDFFRVTLGEYNWFNPKTFGKFSLIRLMTAQKNQEFMYAQGLWGSILGYKRERGLDVSFGENRIPRKLTDLYCYPDDVPFSPNHQFKVEEGYFIIRNEEDDVFHYLTESTVDQLLEDANKVLLVNGVNVKDYPINFPE